MYSVIVCDLFHAHQGEHETEIPGFPNRESAVLYARRRFRSSLEEQRAATPEETARRWRSFGEDCRVVGPQGCVYLASTEMEQCLAQPASAQACDYLGFYRSLIPPDFALEITWAAGSMPPPHHYEYQIACTPEGEGMLRFYPDYPQEDVPVWQENFRVPLTRRVYLHTLLCEHDLLPAPPTRQENLPVGGSSIYLDITSQGERISLQSFRLPQAQAESLRTVLEALRASVPARQWAQCVARRKAYVQERYGKSL